MEDGVKAVAFDQIEEEEVAAVLDRFTHKETHIDNVKAEISLTSRVSNVINKAIMPLTVRISNLNSKK